MLRYRIVLVLLASLIASTVRSEEGTLILHVGGNVSKAVRDRFFELAGGRQAKLIVIPTADPDAPDDEGRLQTWRAREPASLRLLHATTREQAEAERFAAPIRSATGVWISGGRQSLLAATYLRTPVERELTALLKRGGVSKGMKPAAACQRSRQTCVLWRGRQSTGKSGTGK
jgi:cyanophycinase